MSGSKRLLEELDERRELRISFALSIGTLRQCEMHEDVIYEGDGELDRLYRAAAAEFKRDPTRFSVFKAQSDFTDCLRDVVRNHSLDGCSRCDRDD